MAKDDAGGGVGGDEFILPENPAALGELIDKFFSQLMSGLERTFLGSSFSGPAELIPYANDVGASNPISSGPSNKGPVVYKGQSGWSAEENQAAQAYGDACNQLLDDGVPMERVSTKGELRAEASRDAARWRGDNGVPDGYHAGHVPDTTWTGQSSPPGGYMALPERVNTYLGMQSGRFPIGYQPTRFFFVPEE